MDIKEFETTTEIKKTCKKYMNESDYKYKYKNCWELANDIAEFKDMVRESPSIRYEIATMEFLKDDYKYLRSAIGGELLSLEESSCTLTIGPKDESCFITLLTDGGHFVTGIVLDDKEKAKEIKKINNKLRIFDFYMDIRGEMNIYFSHHKSKVIYSLSGEYSIYRRKNFIVFIKD